jgi:hypothetical protein
MTAATDARTAPAGCSATCTKISKNTVRNFRDLAGEIKTVGYIDRDLFCRP